jgi:hypothetical protein
VVSFVHRPFALGERLFVEPIVYEGGWAPEPVWTRWRREISLPLLRVKLGSSSAQRSD